LAVAFIDVVMESDTAGLELCQHIREEQGNKLTQLFIRTGQPGVAPERAVIDRYDINGYFTKAEATEDKLYSLVKSAVRQYLWARTAQYTIYTFTQLFQAVGLQSQLTEKVQQLGKMPSATIGKTPTYQQELPSALWVGDKALMVNGWAESQARAVRDQLDQSPGKALSPNGDKYVKDQHNHQFIKVAAQAAKPAVYWQFKTAMTPPSEIVDMFYQAARGFSIVWS
jgi:hypothetical protein